jgi:hypothetical protein
MVNILVLSSKHTPSKACDSGNPMMDKVYCLNHSISDECTYSFEVLEKIYRSRDDAETELTRIQLIDLELHEWHKANPGGNMYLHFDSDKIRYYRESDFYSIEEVEVL